MIHPWHVTPAAYYPAHYGLIPQTLAEDDDHLDVVVQCQETVVLLTAVTARPGRCLARTLSDID